MSYIYYFDGKKHITKNVNEIPIYEISSPDDKTPAYENLTTGEKVWCLKGDFWHRLTGPARIYPNGRETFWLNDKLYENIHAWLKDHPNPDLYFDALGMTETDKILWFLQN